VFASNALRNEDDKIHHRVAILHNKSLDSIPTSLFIVAELDPLRDDSYNYQEILDKTGVKTKLVLIKGVIHPFFSNPGIFIKSCQKVVEAVQEFMANL
jgi:acetyl esterase